MTLYTPLREVPTIAAGQQDHLRQEAAGARVFTRRLIPGPLQTPAYARAALQAAHEAAGVAVTGEALAAAMGPRRSRAQALRECPHGWRFLVDEAALGTIVDSRGVTIEALENLAELIETLPAGTVGIVANSPRTPPCLFNDFTLLPAGLHQQESVAVELIGGELTLTDREDVAMYLGLWDELAGCRDTLWDAPALWRVQGVAARLGG